MSAGETQALVPAVQALAAQIASALHGAQAYADSIAHEKTLQELQLAGEIQSRFLPDSTPLQLAGWQIAAALVPARDTSGDFYDFVPLPGDRMGVVVADVADKGMGAALYMALSRTLIRTYAREHPSQPEAALRDTNRRILADTRAEQFVTVFYGVLDTLTGTCAYCNAGHSPALVVSRMRNGVQALGQTGTPLGLLGGESWHAGSVRLMPGDALLLYTDGLTEARNAAGEAYGSERLTQIFQNCLGRPAEEIRAAVLDALRAFTGDAPQADDITVMAIVRTRAGPERENDA
jgi:serine phosphatase RsbU (regulator of sigma subunit)